MHCPAQPCASLEHSKKQPASAGRQVNSFLTEGEVSCPRSKGTRAKYLLEGSTKCKNLLQWRPNGMEVAETLLRLLLSFRSSQWRGARGLRGQVHYYDELNNGIQFSL